MGRLEYLILLNRSPTGQRVECVLWPNRTASQTQRFGFAKLRTSVAADEMREVIRKPCFVKPLAHRAGRRMRFVANRTASQTQRFAFTKRRTSVAADETRGVAFKRFKGNNVNVGRSIHEPETIRSTASAVGRELVETIPTKLVTREGL